MTGSVIKDNNGYINYIVTNSTQIKSATGNRGTFDPNSPNILHQEAQLAAPFYSKLRKVIDQKMPNRADVQTINGIMAGSGVKNDELTWSGVKDFLEGKEKVDKKELLDYLDKNQVEVKEVTKKENVGKNDYDSVWSDIEEKYRNEHYKDFYDKKTKEFDDAAFADAYASEIDAEVQKVMGGEKYGSPKFSQYQLPGGENYREVLVTMPYRKGNIRECQWRSNIRKVEEVLLMKFSPSSHFSEPNILYHLRLNDRTTADGKKMLFAEEIQSDWHQKGREEGYAGPDTEPKKPFTAEVNPSRRASWEVKDADGNVIDYISKNTAKTESEAIAIAEWNPKTKVSHPGVPPPPSPKPGMSRPSSVLSATPPRTATMALAGLLANSRQSGMI